MTDPAGQRHVYERGRLDETQVSPTWLDQFRSWFDTASADASILEPTAMQLATADASGEPSVRTVLVKGVDERGLVFFTNYESRKGADLEDNPRAAAVFLWVAHERQVRVSGSVTKVSPDETGAYFATRPRGAQVGAWASPQSQVIASRATLEHAVADVETRFGDGPIPPPPFWGGYRLVPDAVEFWQGRPNRLHDRLRYRREDGGWTVERLAP